MDAAGRRGELVRCAETEWLVGAFGWYNRVKVDAGTNAWED